MEDDKTKYTLDQICTLTGMKKRTVRYYIQNGLVDRPEGFGKGAFYRSDHFSQLLKINKWKDQGLSLRRIKQILDSKKEKRPVDGELPPPLPKKIGTIEVWSHVCIADGVELCIEPKRSRLSPEQVKEIVSQLQQMIDRFHRLRHDG